MEPRLKKLSITAIVLGTLVFSGTTYGATYNVPEQYSTIQAALDAVPSFSKISVRSGAYYENLVWPQRSFITLQGRSGNPGDCIIDGSSEASPVIQLATDRSIILTISDVTIRRGSHDFLNLGAGISINNTGLFFGSVFLTLNTCILRENYGTPLVMNSLFNRSNSLFMSNNLITENEDDWGSGIGSVSVVGSIRGFDNQIVLNDNNGVLAYSPSGNSSFTFQNNDVMFNGQGSGWACGIWVVGTFNSLNIRDNNITGNNNIYSHGIVVGDPHFGIDSSISGSILSNSISAHEGEAGIGIHVVETGTLLVEGNAIAENRGRILGCGVHIGMFDWATRGTTVLRNNMIYNNSVGVKVGNSLDGETFIINNTVVDNTLIGIGADETNMTPPTIANCIVGHWSLETASNDLLDVVATYSDIQDGDPGSGNFSVDPLFVDAKLGNYHIESPSKGPGSPCIGMGSRHVPYLPVGDYDFQVRHEPPDLGADEANY